MPARGWDLRTFALVVVLAVTAGGFAVAPAFSAGPLLAPDLQTKPLPDSGLSVTGTAGDKKLRFPNAWLNAGAGPFEIVPSGDAATDDCNGNGDPSDDMAIKQRVYRDTNGNGTFDRGGDTDFLTRGAGCMAYHPSHEHFHVDDAGLYELVSETTGDVVDVTAKVTFCLVDVTRYDSSLPGSPSSRFYDSCQSRQGISVGWYDTYSASLPGQSIDLGNEPAGEYCLRSISDPSNRFLESDEDNNVAERKYFIDPASNDVEALAGACTSSPPLGSPVNDDLVAAQAVLGPGTIAGSSSGASKQTGEPDHAGNSGGASVWYRWTAPESGTVEVTTCGSSFDTLLAVYRGSAYGALDQQASNNDSQACGDRSLQSRVAFSAFGGFDYSIAVDGHAGTSGDITLLLSHTPGTLANDDLANAEQVGFLIGSLATSNVGASKETGEADHAGNTGGASLWYSWDAPIAASYSIDTCESAIDTLLGIYRQDAPGDDPVEVVSNDNGASCADPANSSVQLDTVRDQRYLIAVDGADGAEGLISLRFSIEAPGNDDFADATALSPGTPIDDTNIGASRQETEPAHLGRDEGASVWYGFSTAGAENVLLKTCGSDFDTLLAVYEGATLDALTESASNDDSDVCGANSAQSQLEFTTSPGVQYWVAIDGANGALGAISLLLEVLDPNAPQTTIVGGPGVTNDTTPAFSFTSTKPSPSYSCSVDGGAFVACGSGEPGTFVVSSPLGEGDHTFSVYATEGGVDDQSPATRPFVIDTTAPNTFIDGPPTAPVTTARPLFHFSSKEPASNFECRFDSEPFGPCSEASGAHQPDVPLENGRHTFDVRARDEAGNVDPTPASVGFEIDLSGLGVDNRSIKEGPKGSKKVMTFTVTLEDPSEDETSVRCKTKDGTARAGKDYEATDVVLTFLSGETSKSCTVKIFGDDRNEKDEHFWVVLKDPLKTVIVDKSGRGTIRDDDKPSPK